jgi:uncharacterized protein (TIGR03435 family)
LNGPASLDVVRFLLLVATLVFAQTFDVASIRPARNRNAESNLDSAPGGRLTATNITVRELIRLAFSVKDYQIERVAQWATDDGYDIAARTAEGRTQSLDEEKTLVRNLLAERFHLATHIERKPMAVYLLVAAKTGPKLAVNHAAKGSGSRKSCGRLTGTRLTSDTIAAVLTRQLDREVLNRTDLAGYFDFELNWTPDAGPCTSDAPDRPSFFTAIQEQLGLKLEPARAPIDFLIVDRLERPSEN